MIVNKQLRDLLAQYPDDLRIMVRGYEGGLEDLLPTEVKHIGVKLDARELSSVEGPHERVPPAEATAEALLLDRRKTGYRHDDEMPDEED